MSKTIFENERREEARLRRPAQFGVYGVMEWHALIPAGRSTLRVPFRGGSMSGFGVTPATYSTTNAAVIRLIEESHWFRRGKIRRLS